MSYCVQYCFSNSGYLLFCNKYEYLNQEREELLMEKVGYTDSIQHLQEAFQNLTHNIFVILYQQLNWKPQQTSWSPGIQHKKSLDSLTLQILWKCDQESWTERTVLKGPYPFMVLFTTRSDDQKSRTNMFETIVFRTPSPATTKSATSRIWRTRNPGNLPNRINGNK